MDQFDHLNRRLDHIEYDVYHLTKSCHQRSDHVEAAVSHYGRHNMMAIRDLRYDVMALGETVNGLQPSGASSNNAPAVSVILRYEIPLVLRVVDTGSNGG